MRSFVLTSLLLAVVTVACAESAAPDTATATASTSTSIADEPAGANCPAGGTKIVTGVDANGNGALDAAEVKETRFVCNGAGGAQPDAGAGALRSVDVEDEPKGANCAAGGVRIESGVDADGDGSLDGPEVTTTKYVCNGAPSDAGASTEIVSAYSAPGSNVQSQASSVTVQQLTIQAPGPGKVVALFSADLFCASPATSQGFDCNASGVTAGYYTLTNNGAAAADTGDFAYFFLTPNATETISRQASFDVAAAGNLTVFVRARTGSAGQYAMYRSTLTLLFVPS